MDPLKFNIDYKILQVHQASQLFSEGPGTFREQRQTTGNDGKISEIMKIVGIGTRMVEMGGESVHLKPTAMAQHMIGNGIISHESIDQQVSDDELARRLTHSTNRTTNTKIVARSG